MPNWEPAADRGLWALSDPRLSNPYQERKKVLLGQYRSLSLSPAHLSHTTNINPFENKVWEIYFYKEVCSFVHWSSSLCLIMFPRYLYMYYVCGYTTTVLILCLLPIGITITFMFNSFFSSLERSRYLSPFFAFLQFYCMTSRTAKSTIRQTPLFSSSFFFFGSGEINYYRFFVFWPRLDYLLVSQNCKEFLASLFQERILGSCFGCSFVLMVKFKLLAQFLVDHFPYPVVSCLILHHHHVVPLAQISMTLSRHISQSFITSGRFSGRHLVSSHSCCMYVRAGRLAFSAGGRIPKDGPAARERKKWIRPLLPGTTEELTWLKLFSPTWLTVQ